ncbi:MAG TPA: PIN domain-containing protein [Gemmataceae bacterium]|jgi:predicted nucleic acid-binding protein|nr:PIN domain-containing protein [Gemmataceae bacterium]
MIFVDTWAWIALLDDTDQYHRAAEKLHRKLLKKRRKFVTSDFVLNELINYLYSVGPAVKAQATINAILSRADAGTHVLAHVSPQQFRRAWELRQKYHDKPDISFVDFTSMVVMQDLGITDVFTGDAHFQQVNLGFRLHP